MARKAVRVTGLSILLLLGLLAAWLYITDKHYFYTALRHTLPDIDDHLIFSQHDVKAPEAPDPWPVASTYNTLTFPDALEQLHRKLGSVAFLVIKQDSLLHEQYWQGYTNDSQSNSFSVAKSIVSILIGVALKEGKIQSLEQPVSDFLPAFAEGDKARIKLKHLLWMSSGLNWDESYSSPISMTTEAYYGTNLKKLIGRLKAVEPPGQTFSYKSGDTQVLGFVLEAATGKTVSAYAEEKLWRRIGAAHDAAWSVDRPGGNEKAYCCFFSNARDFARIGQLYLHHGIWNGDTIVDPAYVQESLTPSGLAAADDGKEVDFYGYQWWLVPDYKGQNVFYARGILGQYIIVLPEKEVVIVRLGKKRGARSGRHFNEIFAMIDAVNAVVR